MNGKPVMPGAFVILSRIIARSPSWLLRSGASFLTLLWATVLPVRREVARQNLEQAFTDLSPRERRRILYRTFFNIAWNYLEFLGLPALSGARLVERFRWNALEHLDAAVAQGKGVLVLSAHLGAFDLLAAATAARGYPVAILSRRARPGLASRIWMGYRQCAGVEIILERGGLKQVLRALRRGALVAFVLDQNMHRDRGIFVRFFGRPACTLDSLAVLALRTGAPVVPAFAWRDEEGRHQVEFLPEIELIRTGDSRQDVWENTQRFTTLIESAIRAHPDQWLWLHRRWKTEPQPSTDAQPSTEHRRASEQRAAERAP